MNLGKRCVFAAKCELFQGKVQVNDIPLPLFRNVFCHRGEKGWKNCARYLALNNENINNEKNGKQVGKKKTIGHRSN